MLLVVSLCWEEPLLTTSCHFLVIFAEQDTNVQPQCNVTLESVVPESGLPLSVSEGRRACIQQSRQAKSSDLDSGLGTRVWYLSVILL